MTDLQPATEQRYLRKRHFKERRLRAYGIISLSIATFILAFLLFTIISQGIHAFQQTEIYLPETTNDSRLEKVSRLTGLLNGEETAKQKRQLAHLFSPILQEKNTNGWYIASSRLDQFYKYQNGKLTAYQQVVLKELQEAGRIRKKFSWPFFTEASSQEPEAAGILGAFVGSLMTLAITLALSFPIGVLASVYLEEFSARTPRGRFWRSVIEININNLAAVPSIVFGLLGLAVFIQFLNFPRSSPLVGGCVLALMTLPTIIIATRAALKAVPDSIRQAARGLGATEVQTVFHHVIPAALPGILTGTIIGMAQALGETAPLLLIGMVAFIADVPTGFTDSATVLPVQIFVWSDSPERGFEAKTAAAIMVLLAVLICMNMLAAWLRIKLEKKW